MGGHVFLSCALLWTAVLRYAMLHRWLGSPLSGLLVLACFADLLC